MKRGEHGFILSEHVHNEHFRTIIIEEASGKRIYSIDIYKRLDNLRIDSCHEKTSLGPASLCYIKVSRDCEVAILSTPGRVELVNLRLVVDAKNDPARGDPDKARELCMGALRDWLQGLKATSSAD